MNCRLLLPVLTLIIGTGFGDSLASAQSTRIKEVMKEKLVHSQEILSAVATSNGMSLERHSLELLRLAKDPAWSALTTPEYARYSSAFLEAAEALVEAAKQRDLELAPVAYVSLTLSCIQCHRYVGRSRVAGVAHGSRDP